MTYSIKYGGQGGASFKLRVSDDLIAIRYHEGQNFEKLVKSIHSRSEVLSLNEVARFSDANVSVMCVAQPSKRSTQRDLARGLIKSAGVRFAGRVLVDTVSKRPVLYTENFFVRFSDKITKANCKSLLNDFGLIIKRRYTHTRNTYFVAAPVGCGAKNVFDIADRLIAHESVELCHPELVRERSVRGANNRQWHLKKVKIGNRTINAHAHVESAWRLSTGVGTTICVIDDGVDVTHQDFSAYGKIVHGRDVTLGTSDPRPKINTHLPTNSEGDAHGTACAGVACASGKFGTSGVAPDAKLMPIRLASGLGSMAEHDAIVWAVDNGADVISCSWGPLDGEWFDSNDPIHDQITPLPDSTRTALEYAVTHGRKGKGCVITWAAGNGNENVDNDGYASSEFVMAVAACCDRSRKSVYSDHGLAIWCAFPSNNFAVDGHLKPRTSGIWTTDRNDGPDEGYNPNFGDGDARGKYTDGFGGTSSACPGVAGVAALMISKNPHLDWTEVCNLIADTADQIDKDGGDYDPDTAHSRIYGYGRVNANRAVKKAISLLPKPE
ncbi:MAG: S8 family peptidase [Arenicella sp.]